MKELILRCALQNAVKYEGKSELGSVLGLVFSQKKDLDKKQVIEEAKKIVNEVNKLSLEEQKKKLETLGEIKKKKVKNKFPELKNVRSKVILRFAPNPNGPMSLGHSRVALWNWFFKEHYKGDYILRFDDTDPRIKVPLKEAYRWFKEDLDWLGIKPNKIVIESKRFKIYYKYAEKLIKMGHAYVDTQPAEKMRKMIWENEISDERNDPPLIVMKKWKKMFTNYKEGGAVLRIKTDIEHPNPAVRDWVAFRIIKNGKHPLVKARVWPLLNFSSAIDDYELGVTHILRGADLEVSDVRQKFIYDYFNWKYPETLYNGKMLIAGIKSTSESAELIKEGKLSGWDDPRLGTIRSLRRKGFQSEAIVKFIKDGGIGKNDLQVNIASLESYNRDVIDKKANRYFVVFDPRKVKIDGAPKREVKLCLHPDFHNRGYRRFNTMDEFYVDEVFEPGKVYRFIDLFNFRNLKFISEELDENLKAKMIHWLPIEKNLVNVEVIMTDNSIKKGFGEKELKKVKVGEIVQFMRIGFARLDKKIKNKLIFYFAHK